MSVIVPAATRAIEDSATLELADPSFIPDTNVDAPIGMNLTSFGLFPTSLFTDDIAGTGVDRVNLPLVVSSVAAAFHGGVDVLTFDRDFHLRSDADAEASAFDGIEAIVKIAQQAKNFKHTPEAHHSRGVLCAEVPSSPAYLRKGVQMLQEGGVEKASILITLQDTSDFDDFAAAADTARAAGYKVWLVVTNPSLTMKYIDVVVAIADVVRVRTPDRALARTLRFALHDAADRAGREILVLADIGIVISASVQAAQERALLVSEMEGVELFERQAKVIGTVYDVADAIESWVGVGAADGVVFTPASLPTDLASVLKGVLPLMVARAK